MAPDVVVGNPPLPTNSGQAIDGLGFCFQSSDLGFKIRSVISHNKIEPQKIQLFFTAAVTERVLSQEKSPKA
jgi:hypothetical protein